MKTLLLLAFLFALAASQASISGLFLGRDKPCRGHYECAVGTICRKQAGALSSSYGRCVAVAPSPAAAKEKYEPKLIKPISQQEYMKALEVNLQNMLAPEQHGSCGNDHFHYEVDVGTKQQGCGSTEVCDNSITRDTYTASPNQVLKVTWWVFNCSTWATTAATKISQSHFDLNNYYAGVGLQFNAYIRYFPCKGTDGTQDYTLWDSNGDKVTTAINKERPNYLTDGSFVVIAGQPENSGLNGFMYLPLTGYSYAGVGFMSYSVVGAGFTTLAHELGHGFGLYHTFKGVSETTNCACAESTASNLNGDYCSDTPPTVKNWDCVSPLAATGANADPCTVRSSYTNPYTNLMSYGTCRNTFTVQQIRRVRCYKERNLAWIIKDSNPLGNFTGPDPTNPPPSAGFGVFASLFYVFTMILAILF